MPRRGISPIVAVVLLIAISVIASVGVWYWVGSLTGKKATPNAPGTMTVNVIKPGEFLLANVGTRSINTSSFRTSNPNVKVYCPVKTIPPGGQVRCGLVGKNVSEDIAIMGLDISPVLIHGNEVGKFLIKSWSYPNYTGWSKGNETYVCGYLGGMMGGYGNFGSGAYTYITLTDLPKGNYSICFDWIKGDSWDAGENGTLYVNDQVLWTQHFIGADGEQVCGVTGYSWDHEKKVHICKDYSLNTSSMTLNFTSNLDQSATDEWWGVNNIQIFLLNLTS